jgi:hypothetical protein
VKIGRTGIGPFNGPELLAFFVPKTALTWGLFSGLNTGVGLGFAGESDP